MIDEQYLIQQIKTGSQKALETVIDRYGSYVIRGLDTTD